MGIFEHFDESWDSESFSLDEFIQKSCDELSFEEVLELIRRDIRNRFENGQNPTAEHYGGGLSQYVREIDKLIAEEQIRYSNAAVSHHGNLEKTPRRIGNFEVIEVTERDSASTHYYAVQRQLERRVKVRAFHDSSPQAITKAKLVALLDHPNLENNVDLVQLGSDCYLISQYEYGNSLHELLENSSDLITPLRTVIWVKGLVEALMESHRYDVAHLAICPKNILIRESGEPVLLNPSMDINLENRIANPEPSSFASMPFPYRSITHKGTSDLNLWMGDTISIGLIFFQLLTRMPLSNFYDDQPLPQESTRLKKLIIDQLEYVPNIEPELKATCKRATVGAMTEINAWGLSDFHSELVILESLFVAETAAI